MFKLTEALYFMDGRFFWRSSIRENGIIFHLLKHSKTDGFTVLCVSVLFNFDTSCVVSHFFKFHANLVMFTCYQHL